MQDVKEKKVVDDKALVEVIQALPALEAMIFEKLGCMIKLYATLKEDRHGKGYIRIYSDNVIDLLGDTLSKTLFEEIQVGFWGGGITNDGKTIWFNPKVGYSHPSGGSNGTDFVWSGLWYALEDTEFEGQQYEAGSWIPGRPLF